MFETLIVQPIFNLLVFIYAIIPGHDFGVAIILFTISIRILLWPLLKKQLHQTKIMRKLQPEIKNVKKKAKGDRQKEAQMLMALYKKHGANPLSSLGLLFVQLPIFFGLFSALNKIVHNPQSIIDFSYSWVKELGHMKTVVADLSNFDESFLGLFDATQRGLQDGKWVIPIVVVAAIAGGFQYLQTRQLMPKSSENRKLRDIMKDSAKGKEPDQSEINAAIGKNMGMIFAPLIFFISLISPAGLALYFATGGVVQYFQQRFVFMQDVEEMEEIADEPDKESKKTNDRKIVKSTQKKTKGSRAQRKKQKG